MELTTLREIRYIAEGVAADCLKIGALKNMNMPLWNASLNLVSVCLRVNSGNILSCISDAIEEMLKSGYNQEVAELIQLSHDLGLTFNDEDLAL
jgi:hypothetical protein